MQETKNDVVEKLAGLMAALESRSRIRNRKPPNRYKDLASIRENLRRVVKREARPFCNCKQIVIADSAHWRDFETEIKTACPIHGQRHFPIVVTVMGYPEDRNPDDQMLAELLSQFSGPSSQKS